MRKRIMQIISLIVISFIIMLGKACAWSGSIATTITGAGGNGKPGAYNPYKTISEFPVSGSDPGWNYTCQYTYATFSNHNVTINISDMYGTPINEYTIAPQSSNILAGTSIGLDIYETKIASWEVSSISVKKYRTKCQCRYYYYGKCTEWTDDTQSVCKKKPIYYKPSSTGFYEKYESCQQTATYGYLSRNSYCNYKYSENVTNQSDSGYINCKNAAISKARTEASQKLSSTYVATYPDSNDIDGTDTKIVNAKKVSENGSGWGLTGNFTVRYSYNLGKKACVNVKTGYVQYKDNCQDEENSENPTEIEKTSVGRQTYFIPLNTKSDKDFAIMLQKANDKELKSGEICMQVAKNYPNYYRELIIKKNGELYSGNTKRDADSLSNGCYLASVIKIPIKQEFYKEKTVNKKIVFDGFNFFFRQIDINDPFPNEIDNNSLWKNYDISTLNASYANNNLLYTAAVNRKTSTIRAYNSTTNYTDWKDMLISGKSSFINNLNVITRNFDVTKNSFYKLGCGPSNSDWYMCGGSP